MTDDIIKPKTPLAEPVTNTPPASEPPEAPAAADLSTPELPAHTEDQATPAPASASTKVPEIAIVDSDAAQEPAESLDGPVEQEPASSLAEPEPVVASEPVVAPPEQSVAKELTEHEKPDPPAGGPPTLDHHHSNTAMMAIIIAVVVALALAGIGAMTYLKSQQEVKPVTPSSAQVTPTPTPVTSTDLTNADTAIDKSLNSTDDAQDFNTADLSDGSLGLQ